jgi:hypothetical protein
VSQAVRINAKIMNRVSFFMKILYPCERPQRF